MKTPSGPIKNIRISLTVPALPKNRMSDIPTTKGGVMIVKFELAEKIPCVVTCGALTRGLGMVWQPEENVIECLSFR